MRQKRTRKIWALAVAVAMLMSLVPLTMLAALPAGDLYPVFDFANATEDSGDPGTYTNATSGDNIYSIGTIGDIDATGLVVDSGTGYNSLGTISLVDEVTKDWGYMVIGITGNTRNIQVHLTSAEDDEANEDKASGEPDDGVFNNILQDVSPAYTTSNTTGKIAIMLPFDAREIASVTFHSHAATDVTIDNVYFTDNATTDNLVYQAGSVVIPHDNTVGTPNWNSGGIPWEYGVGWGSFLGVVGTSTLTGGTTPTVDAYTVFDFKESEQAGTSLTYGTVGVDARYFHPANGTVATAGTPVEIVESTENDKGSIGAVNAEEDYSFLIARVKGDGILNLAFFSEGDDDDLEWINSTGAHLTGNYTPSYTDFVNVTISLGTGLVDGPNTLNTSDVAAVGFITYGDGDTAPEPGKMTVSGLWFTNDPDFDPRGDEPGPTPNYGDWHFPNIFPPKGDGTPGGPSDGAYIFDFVGSAIDPGDPGPPPITPAAPDPIWPSLHKIADVDGLPYTHSDERDDYDSDDGWRPRYFHPSAPNTWDSVALGVDGKLTLNRTSATGDAYAGQVAGVYRAIGIGENYTHIVIRARGNSNAGPTFSNNTAISVQRENETYLGWIDILQSDYTLTDEWQDIPVALTAIKTPVVDSEDRVTVAQRDIGVLGFYTFGLGTLEIESIWFTNDPPTWTAPRSAGCNNCTLVQVRAGNCITSRATEIKVPSNPAGYFLNLTQERFEDASGNPITPTSVENNPKGKGFKAVKTDKARWLSKVLNKSATLKIKVGTAEYDFPKTEDRKKATQKPYINYSILLGKNPQASGSKWILAEKKNVTTPYPSADIDIAVAPYPVAARADVKGKADKTSEITGWGQLEGVCVAPVQVVGGKEVVAKTEYWWKTAASNPNGTTWQPGSAPKKVNATTFLKSLLKGTGDLKGKQFGLKATHWLDGVQQTAGKQNVASGKYLFLCDIAKGNKAPTQPVLTTNGLPS
ncbi:MAG: hypothetical protein FWH04_03405 [Oscillospiraceae bacterium]|nr:hypothetical protein [Oscillospiraceae bacterium]